MNWKLHFEGLPPCPPDQLSLLSLSLSLLFSPPCTAQAHPWFETQERALCSSSKVSINLQQLDTPVIISSLRNQRSEWKNFEFGVCSGSGGYLVWTRMRAELLLLSSWAETFVVMAGRNQGEMIGCVHNENQFTWAMADISASDVDSLWLLKLGFSNTRQLARLITSRW